MRLIDASVLQEEYKKRHDGKRLLLIDVAPTVDAVPVVRCQDCEHKDRESGFCHGRGWPMQLVPDDGFCNKGKERREGAKDGTAEEAEKEV